MSALHDEYGLGAGLNKRRGLRIGSFIKRNISSAKSDVKQAAKHVNIKNAIEVGKFAAPFAIGFIPGVGQAAIAAKIASLAAKGAKVIKVAKAVKTARTIATAAKKAKTLTKAGKAIRFVKQHQSKVKKGIDLFKKAKASPMFNRGVIPVPIPVDINNNVNNTIPVPDPIQYATNAPLPASTLNEGGMQSNFDAPVIQQGAPIIEATPINNNTEDTGTETQPTESLLPVKEVAPRAMPTFGGGGGSGAGADAPAPKNNTLLYIGIAVAVIAGGYMLTKKDETKPKTNPKIKL